jgi:ESS family glutamate:Na+ symporter
MYGMLTGTISSGILLLREIDPEFETPLPNKSHHRQQYGDYLGRADAIFIGWRQRTIPCCFVTCGTVAVYWLALMPFITKVKPKHNS